MDRFPSSRTLRLGRYVSDVTSPFRLGRYVSDVTSRTLRLGRYVSVSSRQTCRLSITTRSRSRRPPSALMLMGCNDAKAAPRTSQHPSRAHHSAHNNQGHSGALKGTQWHAHRSAVKSLRKSLRKSLSKSLSKRDGAAANARCRWTSRGRPQSVQGGPKSPSLTTALTTIMAGLGPKCFIGRSRRVSPRRTGHVPRPKRPLKGPYLPYKLRPFSSLSMRHGAVTHRVIAVISPTSNLHHYKYVPVAQVFSHIAEPCLSLDPSLQRHGVFTVHGQSFHFDTEDTGPAYT